MRKEMKRVLTVAAIVSSLIIAGGCAKQPVKSPEAAKPAPAAPAAPAATAAKPDVGAGMGKEESLTDTAYRGDIDLAISEGRTSAGLFPVYFDFDRSNIRDDQQNRAVSNGGFMKDNASVRLRIEGNCDERGTSEYNLALGERRAMSAKKFLLDMGVAADRMDTISYGEERPLSFGRDDLSWSLNRRADFVVIK